MNSLHCLVTIEKTASLDPQPTSHERKINFSGVKLRNAYHASLRSLSWVNDKNRM